MNLPAILSSEVGERLLREIASELREDPEVLLRLAEAADAHSGGLRRKGMFQAFDLILVAEDGRA